MYGSMDVEGDALPALGRQAARKRVRRKSAAAARSTRGAPVLKTVFKESKSAKKKNEPENVSSLRGGDFADDEMERPATSSVNAHSFVYSMLNPHSNRPQAVAFKMFITSIIFCDVVLYVLGTDQTFSENYGFILTWAEGIASTIFLVEYITRLVVCTESRRLRGMNPIAARLRFMSSFAMVVDLVATLPFFVEFIIPVELPTFTYLRILRLARILKTNGLVRALDAVYRVIYFNKEILYVAMWICIGLVFLTAFLLYVLRPSRGVAEDEMSHFQSIPATLYLATQLLTGQGGLDAETLPWYTKGVVLTTSIFSVAMFAIPASMLTWGFEAEAERMAKRSRKKVLERRETAGSQDVHSETSSSNGSSTDTDEEYFRIIAGDDEDSNDEEDERMKLLRQNFDRADSNADGTLNLSEVLSLQSFMDVSKQPGGNFEKRLSLLEAKAEANARKLDEILRMLKK